MTPQELLSFLRSHRLAVQASVSAVGDVQAAVVGFAVSDRFEIVFDSLGSTRKVANLRGNPRIAVVIGWDDEQTVQIEGIADEPTGDELARFRRSTSRRILTVSSGRNGRASPTSVCGRIGCDTAISARRRASSNGRKTFRQANLCPLGGRLAIVRRRRARKDATLENTRSASKHCVTTAEPVWCESRGSPRFTRSRRPTLSRTSPHAHLRRARYGVQRRLSPARARSGAQLRIRQRISRHRQCRRDGHLHPHAQAQRRRGVVRLWNLIGVMLSTGAVAFGVVSLLPVELVINVGSGAGFAMVFALLISAIIWNLGTWYLGLPASSSHTLIGSIMGVGLANSLFAKGHVFGEGVNWAKAQEVGSSLLISPIIGFVCAGAAAYCSRRSLIQPTRSSTRRQNPGRRRRPGFAGSWCSPARASASPMAPTTGRRAWD